MHVLRDHMVVFQLDTTRGVLLVAVYGIVHIKLCTLCWEDFLTIGVLVAKLFVLGGYIFANRMDKNIQEEAPQVIKDMVYDGVMVLSVLGKGSTFIGS